MFVAAGWCAPHEFWALRPGEVFWIIRAKAEASGQGDQWADLYKLLKAGRDE